MKRFSVLILLTTFAFSVLGNTPKTTLEEYIETWKDVAIKQMYTHGIPASITLSQGILESGFGNSKLAVQANNHFGIKCHDWKGETFLKDDDKRNECFRKYHDASQSFEDHSNFLAGRTRYSALFELEITDYKGWAKGLKTAGYATNPTYDKKLIDLIERYDLNQFDQQIPQEHIVKNDIKKNNKSKAQEPSIEAQEKSSLNKQEVRKQHKVFTNQNRTKYIVAGNHDTFYQIAKEFGVSIHQLNKWNDFPPTKEVLQKGDKVYIMRKRKRIDSNLTHLKNKEAHKLWEISQEYGIQLKALAQYNKLTPQNIAMSNRAGNNSK